MLATFQDHPQQLWTFPRQRRELSDRRCPERFRPAGPLPDRRLQGNELIHRQRIDDLSRGAGKTVGQCGIGSCLSYNVISLQRDIRKIFLSGQADPCLFTGHGFCCAGGQLIQLFLQRTDVSALNHPDRLIQRQCADQFCIFQGTAQPDTVFPAFQNPGCGSFIIGGKTVQREGNLLCL